MIPDKPRKRRIQERAAITIEKIRAAATRCFSEQGYEGATIRDIEAAAGVKRGLITYHFGSKERLWQSVLQHIFGLLDEFMRQRAELLRDLPPRERGVYTVRSYVRCNAAHPELNRLMMQEGKRDTSRLHLIVDTFTRPLMERLRENALQWLPLDAEDFMHWYYMFIGTSGVMYSMAPEAKLLFGVDVTDAAVVDRPARIIVDLLIRRSEH